ncbi:RNA polymerase sigma-70 factor [Puteibacter caeruleilacunae]|nr:RNA polymerase sigma-70 factor [Puteibacter caeruleilacunae]
MTTKSDNNELFIVQRMMEGDRKAFRYFFDQYYADLCNFVNIYVRDEQVAEEVVQDIFVYFWENRERININQSVKSYLFSASKNRSLNHLRNLKGQEEKKTELVRNNDLSDDRPEKYLELEELQSLLNQAIDTLPEKCREIYQLSRDQELSNKEIAQQLDISVKTVENQITIALKKIKVFLQPYNEQIFIAFVMFLLEK